MFVSQEDCHIAVYHLYGAPWVQEQELAGETGAGFLEDAFRANRMGGGVESAQGSLAEYDPE